MEEREEMKFISWNVNGIRACVQKGFVDFFKEADADIFCLQETKMQEGQLVLDLPEYHQELGCEKRILRDCNFYKERAVIGYLRTWDRRT